MWFRNRAYEKHTKYSHVIGWHKNHVWRGGVVVSALILPIRGHRFDLRLFHLQATLMQVVYICISRHQIGTNHRLVMSNSWESNC